MSIIKLKVVLETHVDQQNDFVRENGALSVPKAVATTKDALDATDERFEGGVTDGVLYSIDTHSTNSVTFGDKYNGTGKEVVNPQNDDEKVVVTTWLKHCLYTRNTENQWVPLYDETKGYAGAALVDQAEELRNKYLEKSATFNKGDFGDNPEELRGEAFGALRNVYGHDVEDVFGKGTFLQVKAAQVVTAVKERYGIELTVGQAVLSLTDPNFVLEVGGKQYSIDVIDIIQGQARNFCVGDTALQYSEEIKAVKLFLPKGKSSCIADAFAGDEYRKSGEGQHEARLAQAGIETDENQLQEELEKVKQERMATELLFAFDNYKRLDPRNSLQDGRGSLTHLQKEDVNHWKKGENRVIVPKYAEGAGIPEGRKAFVEPYNRFKTALDAIEGYTAVDGGKTLKEIYDAPLNRDKGKLKESLESNGFSEYLYQSYSEVCSQSKSLGMGISGHSKHH